MTKSNFEKYLVISKSYTKISSKVNIGFKYRQEVLEEELILKYVKIKYAIRFPDLTVLYYFSYLMHNNNNK